MRLAGTWKQYSANAVSQLITMTLNSGAWRYFRCPYQAKVMKMLDSVRSRIVVMQVCCLIQRLVCTRQKICNPTIQEKLAAGFRDRLANRWQHVIHLRGSAHGDTNAS